MPHKGSNCPKDMQSHYTALLKGKKTKSIAHVPRNPLEMRLPSQPQERREVIHLPLEAPDLVNNPRFGMGEPQSKRDSKIPSNKFTPPPEPKPKKARKQKKKRKPVATKGGLGDGLKYMNIREKLLEQL